MTFARYSQLATSLDSYLGQYGINSGLRYSSYSSATPIANTATYATLGAFNLSNDHKALISRALASPNDQAYFSQFTVAPERTVIRTEQVGAGGLGAAFAQYMRHLSTRTESPWLAGLAGVGIGVGNVVNLFTEVEPSRRVYYSDGTSTLYLSGGPSANAMINVATLGSGALLRNATTSLARTVVNNLDDGTRLLTHAQKQVLRTPVQRSVIPSRVATTFDDFRAARNFRTDLEAQKAYEVYQRGAHAQHGLVIGHGDAPIDRAFDGWQALRMLKDSPTTRRMHSVTWTEEINMAWIDGAIDAGKPIKLVTPFDEVRRGTVTWREIQRVISRGGQLVAE